MRRKTGDNEVRRKLCIVGLPNTGKTQVFNNLTGEYRLVANYPATTIVENTARTVLGGEPCLVTDFPGFTGLFTDSEDNQHARRLLVSIKPDCLVQCVDANRLKQSLHLTAQLLELEIPLVISLNAVDETDKTGRLVDAARLSRLLGVPVVECIATEGTGTQELKSALRAASLGAGPLAYFPLFDQAAERIRGMLPPGTVFPRLAARLILEQDESAFADEGWLADGIWRQAASAEATRARRAFRGRLGKSVQDAVSRWADRLEAEVVERRSDKTGGVSWRIAALSRHPLWGLPFLFVFLALLYLSVVHVAGFLEDLLSRFVFDPLTGLVAGILPDGFFQDMFVGDYGVLTLGLFSAVGTVLPVLFVFFMVYGIMEDIGYLPNLGLLLRRVLGKIGLSGKSVMPLILGFGCKTMATLAAKGIPSRKEKIIALYLIAFAIPCSAQLALVIAILGNTGILSFFIYLFFLVLVEALAGIVLNKLLPDEEKSDFIQELPPFRMPRAGQILKKTGHRLWWFLKEAVPIFLIASAALFLVDWSGILGMVKDFVAPLVTGWLGLPVDMVDALLLTLARNEIGAGLILRLAQDGMLTWVQSIVAVTLTTMFVPCIANVIAMFKQVGWKASLAILGAINITSIGLAGGLNFALLMIFGG